MTNPSIALEQVPDIEVRITDLGAAWQRCDQSFARYFSVRVGNPHVVDDLMQQLWMQARIHISKQHGAELEPWLWQIAQNLLREHRRNNGGSLESRCRADPALARQLAKEFDTCEMPMETIARQEVHAQVLLALTNLPSEDQELLVGRYFESRSHSELAKTLGLSERAVEGRLFRARRSLRDALHHLDDKE